MVFTVQLFKRDQSVVSRHINNVFKEGEVEKKSNMQKMHIANSDKPVVFFNFDVIISFVDGNKRIGTSCFQFNT